MSEYGRVLCRVRLRRLSEYGSVAYFVERPTRETQAEQHLDTVLLFYWEKRNVPKCVKMSQNFVKHVSKMRGTPLGENTFGTIPINQQKRGRKSWVSANCFCFSDGASPWNAIAPKSSLFQNEIWSAAHGGLRDGGLSKSEDICGKRPFSSVIWIFSGALRIIKAKKAKKGRNSLIWLISPKGPKIEKIKSRLKISISLEIFNLA